MRIILLVFTTNLGSKLKYSTGCFGSVPAFRQRQLTANSGRSSLLIIVAHRNKLVGHPWISLQQQNPDCKLRLN